MTSFVETNFQTLTCKWVEKIKCDVEFTFDWILKNLAFAPKNILLQKCLFPVTSNIFIFLSKPIFLVLKIPLMAKACCKTRYQKSTLNYDCCWNDRESDKTSSYCINVFVQMIKIFFNWLMRLVDWFHWHFCIETNFKN